LQASQLSEDRIECPLLLWQRSDTFLIAEVRSSSAVATLYGDGNDDDDDDGDDAVLGVVVEQ